MSDYKSQQRDVAEAETSCAIRQSTIFEFMDPSEYDETMTDPVEYFYSRPLGGRVIP